MYARLVTLVLLVGACFAAPQASFDASASGTSPDASVPIPDVPIPNVPIPDVPIPAVPETPNVPIPDVTNPLISVPPINLDPIASVDQLDVGLPHLDSNGDLTVLSLDAQLQALGLNVLAHLLVQIPLSSLVPAGCNVTIPGISNAQLTAILDKLKDQSGNLDLTKATNFLKSMILKDIQFKQQLIQNGLTTIKNLFNQTQNINGSPNGACVWNGGNITNSDIPFAGGVIQKVDNFVPKLPGTLGDALSNVGNVVGGALGGLVNTLSTVVKNLLSGVFGALSPLKNIINNVNGQPYTILLPNQTALANLLSPANALNLFSPTSALNFANNLKQYIFAGPFSPSYLYNLALAHGGQTTITNLLGQQVPVSISSTSAHAVTVGGYTYSTTSGYSSTKGGDIIAPTTV